jgi:hypothetical protein
MATQATEATHQPKTTVLIEADIDAIADALEMRAERFVNGGQDDGWGQWVVATLPSDLSWWWLSDQNDSLLISVNDAGELCVSRSVRSVRGAPPHLEVAPIGSKLVGSRDEAIKEARRILRIRRRSYRRCYFCGERTPPEWGERDACGDDQGSHFVCHGCISTELGLVF